MFTFLFCVVCVGQLTHAYSNIITLLDRMYWFVENKIKTNYINNLFSYSNIYKYTNLCKKIQVNNLLFMRNVT